MTDSEDLMQPGGTSWEDDASCKGDDRFLHPDKTEGLRDICNQCPVFVDCYRWAKGQSDVFAAGFWRYPKPDKPVEDWHGQATGSNS